MDGRELEQRPLLDQSEDDCASRTREGECRKRYLAAPRVAASSHRVAVRRALRLRSSLL